MRRSVTLIEEVGGCYGLPVVVVGTPIGGAKVVDPDFMPTATPSQIHGAATDAFADVLIPNGSDAPIDWQVTVRSPVTSIVSFFAVTPFGAVHEKTPCSTGTVIGAPFAGCTVTRSPAGATPIRTSPLLVRCANNAAVGAPC